MRKTFLILLGAASGAALTLMATQPRLVRSRSAPAPRPPPPTPTGSSICSATCSSACAPTTSRSRTNSKLIESAINGMLAGLDPHSSYMEPKAFRDMQVQTRGEFGGLGIEVTMEDGLIKVVAPIDDTPAAKAGVLANDIITKLDEEQVQGLTLNQAVEKMRGPVNTKIKLTIMRKGPDKPIEVTIMRDIIRVRAVRSRVGGRHRLHPRHPVQRADHRGPEEGDHRSADADPGRQAQGLCARSAQQSGRPARPGDLGLGRVPRARRDRLDPRPQRRRDPALQRPPRRPDQGQAGDRADQRRLGLGVGNRRRRAAGPQARDA